MLDEIRSSLTQARLDAFTKSAIDALLEQHLLGPASQIITSSRLYDDADGTAGPCIHTNTLVGEAMRQTNEAVRGLLEYGAMSNRRRDIAEASAHTCKWVFDTSNDAGKSTDLSEWLEHGHGLFLISGNEGSGKSTLIKSIFKADRTTKLLETWSHSGSSSLVIAAFFFWRSGTELERSEEGLLRSLILSVLEKKPEFSPQVLPKEWANLFSSLLPGSLYSGTRLQAWKVEDLRIAFKRLFSLPIDLFLLIDGLDEYRLEGDTSNHISIIKTLIQDTAAFQNVKILASSRFLEEFHQLDIRPDINLHDLNRQDIRRYVCEALEGDSKFATARTRDAINARKIFDYLLNTAQGSFLWASLALGRIRTLLSESGGLGLEQIQQQLKDRLPASLHKMYRELWSSMSKFDQAQASEILQIVLAGRSLNSSLSASGQLLRLVDLTLAVGDPDEACKMAIFPWNYARIRGQCRRVANKFTMTWPGFITVNETSDLISTPVQFCHRSVLEFLDLTETRQSLEGLTQNTGFCPYTSHIKSAVQHLKILPQPLHKDPLRLLWVFVISALLAANKIDYRGWSPGYVALITQLDRTMQYHHENIHKDPEYQHPYLESKIQDRNGAVEWRDRGRGYKRLAKMHWSNFHFDHKHSHPRYWEDSFLSLAVQFGLKNFVEFVLERGERSQRVKKGRPLLNYALAPSSIAPLGLVTHDLVEALLDHGCKLEEKFEGRTCWENALLWQYETYLDTGVKTVRGSSEEERALAEAQSKIFLLLLRRGADPKISVETSKKGTRISVKDIVERSFKESISSETYQELQQFF